MQITDIWPTFRQPLGKTPRTQLSWTRKGPGRRHNPLTKKQQGWKDRLIAAGMNASDALLHMGVTAK